MPKRDRTSTMIQNNAIVPLTKKNTNNKCIEVNPIASEIFILYKNSFRNSSTDKLQRREKEYGDVFKYYFHSVELYIRYIYISSI